MNKLGYIAALTLALPLLTNNVAGASPKAHINVIASVDDMMLGGQMHGRFGGPVYSGAPALMVTSALVQSGGGAANFSTAKALTNMVGSDLVSGEVKKLTSQYGSDKVNLWLKTFDFAVADSLRIATAAGVSLPSAPSELAGQKLASTLVSAGTTKEGTFEIELLLDKAVTHNIHVQVMNDIDKAGSLGKFADLNYHLISNQAFYDLAQALGAKQVKVSSIH